jgi:hypothetical protein
MAPAAGAQDLGRTAINACERVAMQYIRLPRPDADSVRFVPSPRIWQASNAETAVQGSGAFRQTGRAGGRESWKSFTYRCTYNLRSRQTYGLKVTISATARPPMAFASAATGKSPARRRRS